MQWSRVGSVASASRGSSCQDHPSLRGVERCLRHFRILVELLLSSIGFPFCSIPVPTSDKIMVAKSGRICWAGHATRMPHNSRYKIVNFN